MATATAAPSEGLAHCCYHVPPAALGRLIGPRGATIQQVQQSTGARIDTPKGGVSGSGDLPSGLIAVAAPSMEALEACRLAIEQIVGFAVSPHAPSRVLLDLRADSPLLGKLRADRYAIASRVRASCGLMELEVPGRDNSFECVAAVGTLDNCLAARDMLAAELQVTNPGPSPNPNPNPNPHLKPNPNLCSSGRWRQRWRAARGARAAVAWRATRRHLAST